jgi:predicted thioesterase
MKPGFEPGIERWLVVTVTPDMCPAFDGVVVHRVYSTWSVAHHFEIAARKVLVDFLEPHEEGVGSHVSVDHLAPCPEGNPVRVAARLVEVVRGRHIKVVCECRATWGDRLLATGRQVQIVMNREHLQRYLERS